MRAVCWFTDKNYLNYQSNKKNGATFFYCSTSNAVLLPLVQCGQSLKNPFMAPYGGFVINTATEPPLQDVLQCFMQAKKAHPNKEIILRPYPFYKNQNCPTVLLAKHLNIAPLYTDTTYALLLNQPYADADFKSRLHRGARHKLNRCHKAGFVFRQLDLTHLETAYQLLLTNRNAKGYPLTIDFESLKQLFLNFGSRYELYGVYCNTTLICTAVVVNVNAVVKYTLYLGHLPAYSATSPLVFLIENLVGLATKQKIKIIDLGTATNLGIENTGLANFKKSLGAKPFTLPTFRF